MGIELWCIVSDFGGELRFGDTVFWLGHDAYLEMRHFLQHDGVFMFRGTRDDGETAERWSTATPTLGPFIGDPDRDDHLSTVRESVLDAESCAIDRHDAFPLLMEDQVNGGIELIEVGWDVDSGGSSATRFLRGT